MNNSDIECPQCGAMVYYELDRCPECGFDFYSADEDFEKEPEPSPAKVWGTSLVVIIVGWLVSFLIFIFVADILSFREAKDWQAQSLLLVAGTAFIGGYWASVMARRRPILHGIVVAILCIPNAIILETFWRSNVIESLVRPMTALVWGSILLSGAAGATAYVLMKKRSASQLQADDENDLYDDLLMRVRHDETVADRLIAFERQRAPAASEIELIKNAIARWERDNR